MDVFSVGGRLCSSVQECFAQSWPHLRDGSKPVREVTPSRHPDTHYSEYVGIRVTDPDSPI